MAKEVFKFKLDSKVFESQKSLISGSELKLIAGINSDVSICMPLDKKNGIKIINNETVVDLSNNGIEQFLTLNNPYPCTLKINTNDYSWQKQYISYEELVSLVYGGNELLKVTITYSHGPETNPTGNLFKSEVLLVKNLMRFTVDGTIKS